MKPRVFIDTDIILDLFARRDPFYIHASQLFTMIDEGLIEGCVSSLIFSNLFYILRTHASKDEAVMHLHRLKALVTVLAVDEKAVSLALVSDFSDYEDAIQYYTALNHDVDIITTRNVKDFIKGDIPVMTAEEYVNHMTTE